MSKRDLKPWQNKAITYLGKELFTQRAGLLQLPTGFGKTLVAVELYKKLKEKKKGLCLLIVLPKKSIPQSWKKEFHGNGQKEESKWNFGQPISTPLGYIQLETRRTFKAKFLNKTKGPNNCILEFPYFIVIDESHKHGTKDSLVDVMAQAFYNEGDFDGLNIGKSARKSLDSRRKWPKWLLISATPINPVALDIIDPVDSIKITTDDPEDSGLEDETIILDAMKIKYGALALLSGAKERDWLDQNLEQARLALADKDTPYSGPHKNLAIYPRVLGSKLKPINKRRWENSKLMEECRSHNGIVSQVSQLIACRKAFIEKENSLSSTSFERLMLSGGKMNCHGDCIEGYPYSKGLASLIKRNQPTVFSNSLDSTKVTSLIHLLLNISSDHVLIFCVHRAVAASLYRKINDAFSDDEDEIVRHGIDGLSENDKIWFNEKTRSKKRILIVTDSCSESIDLHEKANLLIHYELPWSPIRIMQRVGRLWRIRDNDKKGGIPMLPGVIHFTHYGSIDEEILSRLKRRWHYLKVLGIDSLTYDQAMGIRLP